MKVLVVDDSALMRRWLKQCMEEIGAEVELARNGRDALERIGSFEPDVVTLDINMPEMDGLTCLSHIMTDHPCPVVMLSSLTAKGAMATLEALELGAVDYFEKPDGTVSHALRESFPQIQGKVRAAAGALVRSGPKHSSVKPPEAPRATRQGRLKAPIRLVMFGVSTGGPSTVEHILAGIDPKLSAPILIALHMPNRFVDPFTERLSSRTKLDIRPLNGSMKLEPGVAVVAGADTDVVVSERSGVVLARQAPVDPSRTWHPSVDRMVETAMTSLRPDQLLAVQLTGMGNDGAKAMTDLKMKGGCTIAESEETAVIFGMPRELIALGGAQHVLPNTKIADEINALVGNANHNRREDVR